MVPFVYPICLWVVGRGKFLMNSKQFTYFVYQLAQKISTSIGQQFSWSSMATNDFNKNIFATLLDFTSGTAKALGYRVRWSVNHSKNLLSE